MLTSEKTENVTNKSFVERVTFEASVEYKPVHEMILSGLSSDLSVGGVYLKTKFPLDIDDTLLLSFSLPCQGQKVPISCNARVAWTNLEMDRRKPNYAPGVGLQFLDLSHEELSTIAKFIEGYDEEKKMNVVCAWCGDYLGLRKGPFGTTSHGICDQCRESLNM